jgi:glycerophosphoryl diester phosphodiesterase
MENSREAMARAVGQGFDLEFDIQLDLERRRLVLSHDPVAWEADRDALTFLEGAAAGQFHALNVKSLYTLPAVLCAIRQFDVADRFLLFDFELACDDRAACGYLMRSISEQGISVAYRLSEREPFLVEYAEDPAVTHLWLDEFAVPWVDRDSVKRLTECGKSAIYVSPDLHGRRDPSYLHRRWDELMNWGIGGICTDYPIALRLRRGTQDD